MSVIPDLIRNLIIQYQKPEELLYTVYHILIFHMFMVQKERT